MGPLCNLVLRDTSRSTLGKASSLGRRRGACWPGMEKRDENDVAKGIVKFLVDVFDETGETVAIATILTMVKKLDQN